MPQKKRESIIVFGSHSDDFVIGAGGAIANYAQDGKKVTSIVFSHGEKSHPWLKEKVVQDMRSKEALEASDLLGCKTDIYDLGEMKFLEHYQERGLEKELLKKINKEKPTKIFTHSIEDPHPDHKAVYQITLDLYEKLDFKPELYVYSVWNPVSFKTNWPSLYVNITKTFSLKLKALKSFRSQKVHVAYPFLLLLFRAIKNGFKIRTLFAEKFFRIK
ncbi:PIG-L family deacetylase [Candidatus Woesearchaeota archaeon]|jgi:LmbE family N-acetylglucosaminyl deacetylase|nr:PIG-L family deacetylase [Candidatus Woesearchaeota archaeon]MBT5342093.1 PIG-L family deacetylase [Candidatus Woesearchaeota archaeon]MBT6773952.1 PIG-L family deacetylase [Candidatus Woesearchaeota archaeon]